MFNYPFFLYQQVFRKINHNKIRIFIFIFLRKSNFLVLERMQTLNLTNLTKINYLTDDYNPIDNILVKTLFAGLYILSFCCSFFGNFIIKNFF
jgi:hypothetical protein